MNKIDFSKVVPTERMTGDSPGDTALLKDMLAEARAFLAQFEWCKEVSKSYFGEGIAGVVAVFLFRIIPARHNVDGWLWVIVGDLPPAYMVTTGNPDPKSALLGYVREMTAWVDAVNHGDPVDDLIPVNVQPTLGNASALRRRLQLLSDDILPGFGANRPGKQP